MLIAYHLHLSYSPLSFGIFQHHPKPFWQATATVKKCHCSVPEGLFLLLPSAALCVGWMNKYISECSACPHQIKALGLWTRSWWSLQRHSSCGAIQMELKEANTFCLSNIIFEVECWGATGGGMVCITWLIVGFQAQWAMALGGTSYNADVSGRSRTVSGDLLKSVIRLFTKAWRERTGDKVCFPRGQVRNSTYKKEWHLGILGKKAPVEGALRRKTTGRGQRMPRGPQRHAEGRVSTSFVVTRPIHYSEFSLSLSEKWSLWGSSTVAIPSQTQIYIWVSCTNNLKVMLVDQIYRSFSEAYTL